MVISWKAKYLSLRIGSFWFIIMGGIKNGTSGSILIQKG